MNRLISIINKVSTKPNPLSFRWHNTVSIIAFLILNLIYIERIFSILQWGKYLYRTIVARSKKDSSSVDDKSRRINVPSVFVEIYYLSVALLMTVLVCADCTDSLVVHCLAIYLLIDSSVWLLYYFFFRRFFEENYAIMHTLEYIVLFPVVITCQAACISIIEHIGMKETFALMFAPSSSSPIFLILLGVLYTAVILGLVISNLPIENVKIKSDHKHHISIIGNGDVVKNRLLHAVSAYFKDVKSYVQVSVIDKYNGRCPVRNEKHPDEKYVRFIYTDCDKSEHVKEIVNSEIVWIATPSYTHYSYIDKYMDKVKLLVVEKPIVVFEQEFKIVRRLRDNEPKNIFCLSYYYLEKALPFVYLRNPLEFYEKYLKRSVPREHVISSFIQLGALKSINLHLCEGPDERSWLQNEDFGGQYFETFLHLVVLAFVALDNDDTIITDNWCIKDNNNVPGSYILCNGHSVKGTSVLLEMGKFMERNRSGVLEYEKGTVFLDFDRRSVVCKFSEKTFSQYDFIIETVDKPNYYIQLDMVERCFSENIIPDRIDGSEYQMKALKWMFEQKKNFRK